MFRVTVGNTGGGRVFPVPVGNTGGGRVFPVTVDNTGGGRECSGLQWVILEGGGGESVPGSSG